MGTGGVVEGDGRASVLSSSSLSHPLNRRPALHDSFLCEKHGGGRCEWPDCYKLHQGKRGLAFFFCRKHRTAFQQECGANHDAAAQGCVMQAAGEGGAGVGGGAGGRP